MKCPLSLQAFKGSVRLHVPDGSLPWLTVDLKGLQGAQLGLSTRESAYGVSSTADSMLSDFLPGNQFP